jgi:hypothetical protein
MELFTVSWGDVGQVVRHRGRGSFVVAVRWRRGGKLRLSVSVVDDCSVRSVAIESGIGISIRSRSRERLVMGMMMVMRRRRN